jgi:hypothetical protein
VVVCASALQRSAFATREPCEPATARRYSPMNNLYLEVLDETVADVNEALHDVNVEIEHGVPVEKATLRFLDRVQLALKDAGVALSGRGK